MQDIFGGPRDELDEHGPYTMCNKLMSRAITLAKIDEPDKSMSVLFKYSKCPNN
jgi:hypothetical protein